MPDKFWLLIALLALVVLVLVGRTVKLFRQSKEAEARIDYSKIRRFDDEED